MDESGALLLDRSWRHFEPLLGLMRDGHLLIDPGVSYRGTHATLRLHPSARPFPLPRASRLRHGCAQLSAGVLAEAHFFGIWEAIDLLEAKAKEEALQENENPPLRRKELVWAAQCLPDSLFRARRTY